MLLRVGERLHPDLDVPFDWFDLARLGDREAQILLADATLCGRLCRRGVNARLTPTLFANDLRERYTLAGEALRNINDLIDSGAWSDAGIAVMALPNDEVTRLAAADFPEFAAPATAGEGDAVELEGDLVWSPMSRRAAKRLNALFGREVVARRWTLEAGAIGQGLALKSLAAADFPDMEMALLQRSWTVRTQRTLVRAGRFDCLCAGLAVWPLLPLETLLRAAANPCIDGLALLRERLAAIADPAELLRALVRVGGGPVPSLARQARNLIAEDSENSAPRKGAKAAKPPVAQPGWVEWIAPCIGSALWKRAVAAKVVNQATLQQVLMAFQPGRLIVSPGGIRRELLALLAQDDQAGEGCVRPLLRWLDREPASVALVARAMSAQLCKRLCGLGQGELPDALLDRLAAFAPAARVRELWDARMRRVANASNLRKLMIEAAQQRWKGYWSSSWLALPGTVAECACALVLAARRAPRRLKALRVKFGEAAIRQALREAAAALPHNCRGDAAYLEILSVIGTRNAPTLGWLLAQRRRRSGPGRRVDHLYKHHALPKKSGGSRVISVPHDGLKRIQRALLMHLLTPLGAHPCAFGFVKGRSIRDNAAVHVGQPIVANADVRNCFPSIAWPLVLAALRRDLGATLSAAAISAIVDICTAKGGLPIGAPTSPALLNRVLLRTDEILDAQAKLRNCRYSRYADDVSFSGDHGAVRMLGIAERTLKVIGLEIDPRKTNIFRRGRRQVCTGLVVNEKVSVPRRIRRRLRAAVHAVEQGREPAWHGEPGSASSLKGRLAFLNMINPEHAGPLMERLDAALQAGGGRKKRKGAARKGEGGNDQA